MAIARVNSGSSYDQSVSFIAYSFDCGTGTTVLVVGVYCCGYNGNVRTITSATFAGSNMTLIGYTNNQSYTERRVYLYAIANPASGANNIYISWNGSCDYVAVFPVSYSSAGTVGIPDSYNTYQSGGGQVTAFSCATTTVANNCWLVGLGWKLDINQGLTAGTGTTVLRSYTWQTNAAMSLGDSNGAKTPAGSYSLGFTSGMSAYACEIVASISPALSAIKSINGLAKASVKSVNGLAIASVKSWDGLA